MKQSEVYGGNFIKANAHGTIDLPGAPETLIGTISGITTTEMTNRKDPTKKDKQRVLAFKEHGEWRLGLNVTNWKTIARFTGKDDDDHWLGVQVELFVVPEDASSTGYAIRVKKPSAAGPVDIGGGGMGALAATRLTERIAKLAAEGKAATLDGLRVVLAGKYPQHESKIAGEPATWPPEIAKDIAAWFTQVESFDEADIPF